MGHRDSSQPSARIYGPEPLPKSGLSKNVDGSSRETKSIPWTTSSMTSRGVLAIALLTQCKPSGDCGRRTTQLRFGSTVALEGSRSWCTLAHVPTRHVIGTCGRILATFLPSKVHRWSSDRFRHMEEQSATRCGNLAAVSTRNEIEQLIVDERLPYGARNSTTAGLTGMLKFPRWTEGHLSGWDRAMKNVQVVDDAVNAAYCIYRVSDRAFVRIFPNGQDIEFVEDLFERVGKREAASILESLWKRPVYKKDVRGIHGTLFFGLRDEKAEFYPTKRELEMTEGLPPNFLKFAKRMTKKRRVLRRS